MISVAIDGPAGAGKSTIARKAAEKLGYIYVDTGALYRTVGLAATQTDTDITDSAQCSSLLSEIKIDLIFIDGVQRVLLNGKDVSDEIRTPKASMMASSVSAVPAVRAFLLETQRDLARKNNVIMDGRDIGTVVLPDAQVKIFLTASPEIRAKRRYDELTAKGTEILYEEILNDIIKRDYQDSHREIAPLVPAEDSVLADTSNDNLEQAIEKVYNIIKNKIG